MPTYAKNIPDVRQALLEYEPHPVTTLAIEAAQAAASPVVAFVRTFDALKDKIGALEPPAEGEDPTPVLTEAGLKLLAGCAYLIAGNAWHGLGTEAMDTHTDAVAALAELETA